MARVFVSHAGQDDALCGQIVGWLRSAGHELFYDRDTHSGVVVGDRWRDLLYERLRWADAMVCVVSAAYVESPWCAAEATIAVDRGSRVLPVVVNAGIRHPLLDGIQYVDYVADPDRAREQLQVALGRVDAAGGTGWGDDRNPFPGLAAFDRTLSRVFFGRHAEIVELAAALRAPNAVADRGLLVVTGPSGCGKSSLLRAGLIPEMAQEPDWWALPAVLPNANPTAALAREITRQANQLGAPWQLPHVHDRMTSGEAAMTVDELLLNAPGRPRHLLIVLDQMEELLTLAPPPELARFADVLRTLLDGSARVVGTIRPEFLTTLLTSPQLSDVPVLGTVTVRPLPASSLPTVITGPAEVAGLDIDPDLVTRLVADTGTGDALPLLAFTLQQLAQGVPRGGALTLAHYQLLGGVQGALTRQADQALTDATHATGRDDRQILAGMLRLVTVDDQGQPVRARVPVDELPEVVRTELAAFTTRRLLTTDAEHARPVIAVAHEAFLSAWPPLSNAITQHTNALRARRQVETAAATWDVQDRPGSRLWGGGQLSAALNDLRDPALDDTAGRRRPATEHSTSPPAPPIAPTGAAPHRRRSGRGVPGDVSPTAREFLGNSIRTDRRRRTRVVSILTTLLVLAVLTAGYAVVQQRNARQQQTVAERQRNLATARQLLGQANDIAETDPRTAIDLALTANLFDPAPQSRAALFRYLVDSRMTASLGGMTGDEADSVAIIPDGHTLVTGSADGTVILWDITDPTRATRLGDPVTGHTNGVTSMAVTPDGHTLATGSRDGTVILWDITDPTRASQIGDPLTGHTDRVESVVVTADGHTLAAGGADGTVILWDIADPTRATRIGDLLTGQTFVIYSVAVTPDGHTLASGSADGTVILWDITDPTRATRIGEPLTSRNEAVQAVAVTPDGHTLAAGSRDGTVILWDIADPTRATRLGDPLTGQPDGVASVVVTADGHTLATGNADGTVILWDITDPIRATRLGEPLTGHINGVASVAVTPDGHTLATGSIDGTVILWDLTRPTQVGEPLTGHGDVVSAVAVTPDGHTLATGSYDGTVILWDITDPTRASRVGDPLTGPTHPVFSVAVTPDGHTLATGSADGTVILWDITDPTRASRVGDPLTSPIDAVQAVAVTSDGHTLAAGSRDGVVILWDITDPTRATRLGEPLTEHANGVGSVAFTPDGRILGVGSRDGTVILWDITDQTTASRLGDPLNGHTDGVESVAFTPDGHTLATGNADGTVILWDIADPTRATPIGDPLNGHTFVIYSVAVTPDGHTLATGSADGTVILWDVGSISKVRNQLMSRACAVGAGGLTQDQWTRYVPDLPYQDACLPS